MRSLVRILWKHRRRAITAAVIVALAAIIWGEVSFRMWQPHIQSQGHNAIWLRHSWVGSKHTPAEYRALAKRMTDMGITDMYFHTGPMNGDGTVSAHRYRHAGELIRSIKAISPRIRVQAWLGQVEAGAGGPLRVSSSEVRKNILMASGKLLDLGFDGIHFDIEPIYSGNQAFIDLLSATHKITSSRHAVLSVAACKLEPVRGTEWLLRLIIRNPGFWNRDYFIKVAGEVDQVAVMCYDSAIPLPSLYARSIARTVTWSIEHGVNDLIIGVPTYDNVTASHYPYVENVANALKGLRLGTASLDRRDRARVGAGIYAEWTTSDTEWRDYQQIWSRPPR